MKLMRSLLCMAAVAIATAATASPLEAQRDIRIQVVDASGGPVAYAVVDVDGSNFRVADDSGRLTIRTPRGDSFKLRARRIGYRLFDDRVTRPEVRCMAIEIYPSTANAPAELIPLTGQGSCGIVAIWTGPRQ